MEERRAHVLTIRILDFFLLFPAEIETTMIMPAQWRSWKSRFRAFRNKYFGSVSPQSVFMQMSGPQVEGLRLLVSRRLIDPEEFQSDIVALIAETLPPSLAASIESRNSEETELVEFLVSKLATLELRGLGGLKQRTGLVEYRYDAV
ncbi:MAG: ABC-three component system middle component 5 [Phycisphaerales bacterium]